MNTQEANEADALQFLRCGVAEEAVACWHDTIKNRIQSYSDRTLSSWLEDGSAVTAFEARLQRVIIQMPEYSLAFAARLLRPIAAMPEATRADVMRTLDELFEHGFSLESRRRRLQTLADTFSRAVEAWRKGEEPTVKSERLAAIRAAAAALREELESLPAGFWLPPRQVGSP